MSLMWRRVFLKAMQPMTRNIRDELLTSNSADADDAEIIAMLDFFDNNL